MTEGGPDSSDAGKPVLIVVSGPPGAGKTTLAHLVAAGVGCPAICRDEIREGIIHAGTPDADLLHSYRTFVDTVTGLVRAGVTVVAEAAFQDHLWHPLLRLEAGLACDEGIRSDEGFRLGDGDGDGLGLGDGLDDGIGLVEVRVIRCRVTPDVARRRIAERGHRPAHPGVPVAADAWVPISAPLPTLVVDTDDGYSPGLPDVIAFAGAVTPR